MAEGGYDVDMDPLGEGAEDINTDDRQPLLESSNRISRALRRITDPRTREILGLGDRRYDLRTREYNEKYGVPPAENIELNEMGERPEHAVQTQETSFTNDGMSRVENLEENQNTAEERIKELYPEWDPSKANFTYGVDEYGRTTVRLRNRGAKAHLLTSPELPQTILNNLGRSVEEIREYDEAKKYIDSLFPDNKITIEKGFDLRYNEGEIEITHKNLNNWHRLYNKKSGLNGNLSDKIKDALGESSESKLKRLGERSRECDKKLSPLYPEVDVVNREIDDNNRRRSSIRSQISEAESEYEMYHNSQRQTDESVRQVETIRDKKYELIAENNKLIDDTEALVKRRDALTAQIHELEDNRQELEDEMEIIEEKLPLKERIKLIFKKYGFTAFAIASAVGIVIGVIINSLKSGLSSVAKGLGKGLKTIGEKLAHLLPGMVGAIASFIFKTAGQVVGFLAKHTWLLIVAAVLYAVEQYKKK